MAVVLLSGDLMGASRVEGAARQAGAEFQMLGSVDAVLHACDVRRVTLVAADLATAGLDVRALVEGLRRREKAPAIVAYGPHVHEAVLAAAQAAGCDQVLSRGQFMSQIDALLAQHAIVTE